MRTFIIATMILTLLAGLALAQDPDRIQLIGHMQSRICQSTVLRSSRQL